MLQAWTHNFGIASPVLLYKYHALTDCTAGALYGWNMKYCEGVTVPVSPLYALCSKSSYQPCLQSLKKEIIMKLARFRKFTSTMKMLQKHCSKTRPVLLQRGVHVPEQCRQDIGSELQELKWWDLLHCLCYLFAPMPSATLFTPEILWAWGLRMQQVDCSYRPAQPGSSGSHMAELQQQPCGESQCREKPQRRREERRGKEKRTVSSSNVGLNDYTEADTDTVKQQQQMKKPQS